MQDGTVAGGRANVNADREVPDIIHDLGVHGPWPTAAVDPVVELARFEAAAELQRKLLPASVKATLPDDWIDQGGKAYLQAPGVERLAPLWGLWFGRYTVTREEHPDGNYSYIVEGPAMSRRTGVGGIFTGGRSSADPFFDTFDEDKPGTWKDMDRKARDDWKRKHRIAPDPMELRKAAVTNWSTRAGSMLMGMRGLTVPYLETLGIKGVRRIEYATGAKGGATAPADLQAKRTGLWNDCLRRTEGDVDAARSLLKEVSSWEAYTRKKDGEKVKAFAGHTNTDTMSERAIAIAEDKLRTHTIFGDEAKSRQPGEEPDAGA